jgi:hypothetical protein
MQNEANLAELVRCVLESPGSTPARLRAAVFGGDDVAPEWSDYVTKVRERSYRVTDEDVARLIAAGHTEDEIFEITIAAALGAAARLLDAGLRALSLPD